MAMNKEFENINKLIKKTAGDTETFNNNKKRLSIELSALKKEYSEVTQQLADAVKDINTKIKELEKKKEKTSKPFYEKLNNIEEKQEAITRDIKTGESKIVRLARLQKIKEILEKIDTGYYITEVETWGTHVTLGEFNRNNYRPDGWHIIDLFIKGTSVYCQSDIAKSPRKLFDLTETYRWSVVLADSLKPFPTKGGKVIECPKCGLKDAVQSKACPICRTELNKNPIEYVCNTCGHVIDFGSKDKHIFSDDPKTLIIKTEF